MPFPQKHTTYRNQILKLLAWRYLVVENIDCMFQKGFIDHDIVVLKMTAGNHVFEMGWALMTSKTLSLT